MTSLGSERDSFSVVATKDSLRFVLYGEEITDTKFQNHIFNFAICCFFANILVFFRYICYFKNLIDLFTQYSVILNLLWNIYTRFCAQFFKETPYLTRHLCVV